MQESEPPQLAIESSFTPEVVADGKTKTVYTTQNPELVRIVSKDTITAGDGVRKDIIEGKGEIATKTTANVFKLLEAHGIPIHFVRQDSPTTFIAKKVDMIQLECVARRIATGSYTDRHEGTEGQRFEEPPVEFYIKNDSSHDPIIEYDKATKRIFAYDAHSPDNSSIGEERLPEDESVLENFSITPEELEEMEDLTRQVFLVLEDAWKEQNIDLIDMKIEFGRLSDGSLVVADVIDNDSWRIWPDGDKSKDLSKQVYRNLPPGADLKVVKDNYVKVAEMTENFVPLNSN